MSNPFHIVLGLGANVGDRLRTLAGGVKALSEKILEIEAVSAVFESEALLLPNSPDSWNLPFFNIALSAWTSHSPQSLLSEIKNLEQTLGRQDRGRWAPREIDIDILSYGDEIIDEENLHVPHAGLTQRPFALWPFAAVHPLWQYPRAGALQGRTAAEIGVRWGEFFPAYTSCRTRIASPLIQHAFAQAFAPATITLEHPKNLGTELVGILNVTPDSFSDGGKFSNTNAALEQAKALIKSGAEIIDIGAESTRPGAAAISIEEEWSRLEPLLHALRSESWQGAMQPFLSLDTRHPEIFRRALEYKIDWLNDVTGLHDPELANLAASSGVDVVIMHSLSIPPDKDKVLTGEDPIADILRWGKKKILELAAQGIGRGRLILDPGIGFGKTAQQSWQILREISRLKDLGVRLLIGHSRKSFLSLCTDAAAAERDPETSIVSSFLDLNGVDYLRIHDSESTIRALRTARLCYSSRT